MISRDRWLSELRIALRRSRVVALVGPRQSGKTTLARSLLDARSSRYFDLEDPRALARSEAASFSWREQMIRTFLERDLPQLGVNVPAPTLLRFWTMIAHYHGGIWNAAEAARSLGTSEPAARRYLDLLSGLFMVRQLQPWHQNLKKRQVKTPKVYLRDSGLLHALLGLESERALLAHPKAAASWEGYAIEEALRATPPREAYFWATHSGAELDLMFVHRTRRYGVEVKYQDAPRMTPSMRTALADLALERITVLYPGTQAYDLDRRVHVLPLAALAEQRDLLIAGKAPRSPRS